MARVQIDDKLVSRLQGLVGDGTPAKLTEDALTLLDWAANEVKNGRTIFSADKDAKDVHKLAMPALTRAAKSSDAGR